MIVVQDRREVDGKVVTWYSRYYLRYVATLGEGGWGPVEIDIFIFLA